MISARHLLVAGTSLSLIGAPARKGMDCPNELRQLEGWTVIKATSVRGTFEGCDYGKLIELSDGTILRCASYGYQYAYSPDAIVFGKSFSVSGKSAVLLKIMVEDEMYDVSSR